MENKDVEKIKEAVESRINERVEDAEKEIKDEVQSISSNQTFRVLTHILEDECDSEVCNAIREKITPQTEKQPEEQERKEESEKEEQEKTEAEEPSEKTESGDFEKIHEELKEIREGLVHEPEKEEKEEETEYEYSYQKVMDQ